MQEQKQQVYDYKEHPDKHAGRCDRCGNGDFYMSVKQTVFIRTCKKCGMQKCI